MIFDLCFLSFGFKLNQKNTVSVIGAGRLGGALAIALANCGYFVQSIVSRTPEFARRVADFIEPAPAFLTRTQFASLPESEIFFIVTSDPEISAVSETLAANFNFKPGTIFFHTSGSLSSEILREIRAKGGKTGSIHPLVSISDARLGSQRFAGAYFCVEGDPYAVEAGKKIVKDLGGTSFELEARFKTLYHAAAVMTAGHFVALFDVAAETLAHCGIEKEQANRILLPLARSAVENLSHQPPEKALTGTFARADLETMQRHLQALQIDEDSLGTYCELGWHSLKLAEKQNANGENLDKMRRILIEIINNQSLKL